ncbi:MAG: ROK family protein, partial [Bacteroidaceae bacterium]|nr:ROK family protein [Bacteroidaceae bacterium]
LGTGVGSGIVVDGKIVYGSDGFAGELGHFVVDHTPAGRKCGCGRSGCLETYCSATGVARTAREFLEKNTCESLLRNLDPANITSYDVFKAAEQGDKIALDIFDFTGKMLGTACADFTTFNTPEAFVFFGGLTKAGDYLMKPLKEAYDANVLNIFQGNAKLLISSLNGSEAAVLGASALGWE